MNEMNVYYGYPLKIDPLSQGEPYKIENLDIYYDGNDITIEASGESKKEILLVLTSDPHFTHPYDKEGLYRMLEIRKRQFPVVIKNPKRLYINKNTLDKLAIALFTVEDYGVSTYVIASDKALEVYREWVQSIHKEGGEF